MAVATTPVREALAAAAAGLGAAGVDSPRLDAELLLAEATGWTRARIAADPDAALDPAAAREFGVDGAPPAAPRAASPTSSGAGGSATSSSPWTGAF